jgi:hypothetical protein
VKPGRFVLTVENTARRTRELELLGRPPAVDFIVEDSSGGEVWRRLRLGPDEALPLVLSLRRVDPGEAIQFDATHDLPGGSYTVRGILPLADDRCLETGAQAFEVR